MAVITQTYSFTGNFVKPNQAFTGRSKVTYYADNNSVWNNVNPIDQPDFTAAGYTTLLSGNPVDNLVATADPLISNDSTQGYSVGSFWDNTTAGRGWLCTSSAAGNAVWRQVSQNTTNFRNLVDGGDMTINPWQRGTSFSSIAATATYTADRWFIAANAASSVAASQASDTNIVGFTNSLKYGRPSLNTDTHAINLGHILENLDCIRAQGQQVTLSFWARTGANYSGGPLTVALNHSTTSGNDTAAHLVAASTNWQATPTIINTTQALTTTMTRYQFTGTCPATLQQLGILMTWTPTGTAGSDDNVYINGIQLEIGGIASEFEKRDIAVELEICQRYAWAPGGAVGAIGTGAGTSTTAAGFFVNFPVQMRAAPTALAVTTVADLSVYTYANTSVAALTGLSFGSASVNGCHATATVASGLTSGVPYVLYVNTALAGNVVFSADF